MIPSRAYVLVYTGTKNNMNSRTVSAKALRMSNSAGGGYFMSLHSGRRIHSCSWEELPINEYVVERVESLAEAEEESVMHNGMPSFELAPGI